MPSVGWQLARYARTFDFLRFTIQAPGLRAQCPACGATGMDCRLLVDMVFDTCCAWCPGPSHRGRHEDMLPGRRRFSLKQVKN